MRHSTLNSLVVAVSFMALANTARPLPANDGDPVAIRRWSGGMVTIETHWGLHVAVHPNSDANSSRPADLMLFPAAENHGTAVPARLSSPLMAHALSVAERATIATRSATTRTTDYSKALIGMLRSRIPVALYKALAIAGATAMIGVSPAPTA